MFGFIAGALSVLVVIGIVWYVRQSNRPAIAGGLGRRPSASQATQTQGVGQIPNLVNPIPWGHLIIQVAGGTILFAIAFYLPYGFTGWQWLHLAWFMVLTLAPAFWGLIGLYQVPMEHLRLLLWGGNALFTVGRQPGIAVSRFYWHPIWWRVTSTFSTTLVSQDVEIKNLLAKGGTVWTLVLRIDYHLADLYTAMVRHQDEADSRGHLKQIIEGLGAQLTGKFGVNQMAALQAVLGDVEVEDDGTVAYHPHGQLSAEEREVAPVALARVEAVVADVLSIVGYQMTQIDVQRLESTAEVMASLRQRSLSQADLDRGRVDGKIAAAKSQAENAGTIAILDALAGTIRDADGNIVHQGRQLSAEELRNAGLLEHGVDVLVEGGGGRAGVQIPAQGSSGGQRRGQRKPQSGKP